jgi:hypothetical protein
MQNVRTERSIIRKTTLRVMIGILGNRKLIKKLSKVKFEIRLLIEREKLCNVTKAESREKQEQRFRMMNSLNNLFQKTQHLDPRHQ